MTSQKHNHYQPFMGYLRKTSLFNEVPLSLDMSVDPTSLRISGHTISGTAALAANI